ncbi:MAG: PAS domain S-box protein [Ignavibacteriales bacterium]
MSKKRGWLDAERAEVLLGIIDLTSGSQDLDGILNGTARLARELSGADEAAVFLYEDGGRSVVPAAVVGPAEGTTLVGEKIALRLNEDSIFWKMRTHGGVLEILDPGHLEDVVDLSRFTSLYLAPMTTDEGVLGVLLLGISGSNGEPHRAGGDIHQRRLFATLAKQAAVVISRAKLFGNLEKSEEKYRRLTENASDIVFSLDASGRFTFLNSRVLDILGYRPEDLVGEYYSEIVTPESWEATRNALRACLDRGETQIAYEWVATSKSGGAVLLDVRASVLVREGHYAGQQGIARDITEQRRMEAEIKRSRERQSEMRDYLALVTRVQEEERKRVARELHDDTAQALVALSRRLETTIPYVRTQPDEACRRLDDLTKLVDTALANVRRFTRDLRPSILDDLGLIPALEWLVSDMQEHNTIRGEVIVQGPPRRLPSDTETAIYRIVQEALNNIKKHAGASLASVFISFDDDSVKLTVTDNGRGFDAGGYPRGFAARGRLGMVGMSERAQLVGGVIGVESVPGRGTTVRLEIPCRRGAADLGRNA